MTSDRITGGCQCGAVRYAVHGRLGRASICHCRMCQKAFGSFFGPLVSAARGDFELTRGEIARFRSSEPVERGFCRDCGSPLTFEILGAAEIDISIGSLDDPSLAKPAIQLAIEARMPWFEELASLPGPAELDPKKRERLERVARTNRQHPDHDTAEWPPVAERKAASEERA